LWIVVQERVELKKSKYWTSCMNSTYSIYVLPEILFNPLPIAHEARDLQSKAMIISELLGLDIYVPEFRLYPIPVLSDSIHLHLQPFKVLGRSLKIFQRLFI
jgi:hypothetical protein